MPATLPMPTSAPLPRSTMPATNGWKVAAIPRLLVAKVCAMTSRSSRSAVSMPTLMPAFAITTSGSPSSAMQALPAAMMLSACATSAPYTRKSSGPSPLAAAQA